MGGVRVRVRGREGGTSLMRVGGGSGLALGRRRDEGGTSLMRVLSELRPRTPSGPGMCLMGSVFPPSLKTSSAIWFIETW